MKFKNRVLIGELFFGVLAGAMAMAAEGGMDSGGGNLVVCFDTPSIPASIRAGDGALADSYISHITTIEAYDLFEASLASGLSDTRPDLIPVQEGESPEQYVEKIATRFEAVIPAVSGVIRNGRERFPPERILNETHGLRKIDDINSMGLIDSENCVLATGAVQYVDGDENYLLLDSRLFSHPKHSKLSQAVLLLHEYVYSYARKLGQTDSRNTRRLVDMSITQDDGRKAISFATEMMSLGFLPRSQAKNSNGDQLFSGDESAVLWVYTVEAANQIVYDLTIEANSAAIEASSNPALAAEASQYLKDQWKIDYSCPYVIVDNPFLGHYMWRQCSSAISGFAQNGDFNGKRYSVSKTQKESLLALSKRIDDHLANDLGARTLREMTQRYDSYFANNISGARYLSDSQRAYLTTFFENYIDEMVQTSQNDYVTQDTLCGTDCNLPITYVDPMSQVERFAVIWGMINEDRDQIDFLIPSEAQVEPSYMNGGLSDVITGVRFGD